MTTIPPDTPLPSRRELRERARAQPEQSTTGVGSTGPLSAGELPTGELPAGELPTGLAPSAREVPAEAPDSGDVTLTRRQLRALREAQGFGGAPTAVPEDELAQAAEERPRGRRAADTPPDTGSAPVIALPAAMELETEPEVEEPPVLVEPPTPPSVPAGHWSRQAEAEDELDTVDGLSSRDLGTPAAVSNALVIDLDQLPLPTADAPMSGHGEILMTGSLQLPHDFAATGMTGQVVDTGALDDILDLEDVQPPDSHSQPVRAANAVSIHTETSGSSLSLVKQKSTRGLTALIVVASVMAALVLGILVLAVTQGLL